MTSIPANPRPGPASADRTDSFFFGLPERQLFGCFHPAQGSAPRSTAVLLCYPSGRDYVVTHRVFRRLAIGLARAGLAVLRFDYYGCGDSAGDAEEGSVALWSADIDSAIDELKARSGATLVCLLGFRLGASLAALAGARLGSVDRMVLWDPVIDGARHLQGRVDSHARWSARQVWGPRQPAPPGPETECLGFPMTPSMQAGKRGLDLLALKARPAGRILLLATTDQPELDDCQRTLERLGGAVDRTRLDWPEFWVGNETLADVLMPPVPVLQAIVAWVSGACQ